MVCDLIPTRTAEVQSEYVVLPPFLKLTDDWLQPLLNRDYPFFIRLGGPFEFTDRVFLPDSGRFSRCSRKFSRVEMWRGGLGKAYPLPTLSSVGASLARPCSVSTSRSSNRTCGFPASGSRTRPYAFAHGRSRVRSVSRTSPNLSYRNWSGNCRVPLLPCFLCFRRNH